MNKQVALVIMVLFLFCAVGSVTLAQSPASVGGGMGDPSPSNTNGGVSQLDPCSCDPQELCICHTETQVIEYVAGPTCQDACANCKAAHGGEDCVLCHSGLSQGQKLDCKTGNEYGH